MTTKAKVNFDMRGSDVQVHMPRINRRGKCMRKTSGARFLLHVADLVFSILSFSILNFPLLYMVDQPASPLLLALFSQFNYISTI